MEFRSILLLASSLFAAYPADSPVRVLRTDPSASAHIECASGGPCIAMGRDMSVQYENTSGKEIVAVKFKILFLNGLGEKQDPLHYFTSEKKLKPGKKATAKWENILYLGARRMEVTTVKVAFDDGSIWEPAERQ